MKIINKGRGNGKTWDLIKEASEKNIDIIAFNKPNKEHIERTIKKMYDDGIIDMCPRVHSYSELKKEQQYTNRYLLDNRKFMIDELDLFLRDSMGLNIETATMTGRVDDYNRSYEDNKAFLFDANVRDVFDMVKKCGKYKVDYLINNDEFLTDNEKKKFMKHLGKLVKLSRMAFIRKAEKIVEEKGESNENTI